MTRRVTRLAPALFMFLTICSCATGYHSSFLGGGYSDTQLAPDVFRITFSGNAMTRPERVQDFALLRAAEVCLTQGYGYFAVLLQSDQTKRAVIATPSTATSSGYVSVSGNTLQYCDTTTYTPGMQLNLYYPGVGLIIRAFARQPKDIPTFDADFLIRSLNTKYKLN